MNHLLLKYLKTFELYFIYMEQKTLDICIEHKHEGLV